MVKIYNEIIIDMNPESSTFEKTIHEDSYEYSGDMMLVQEGLYMGGERNIGFGNKQIRDLVAKIKEEQKKFQESAAKANIWSKIGDVIQGGLSIFGGVPGIVAGSIADFLIDTISSQGIEGDPEGIKELETAYTGSGFGEEFGRMKESAIGDPWSSFLANTLEGLTAYGGSKLLGGGGGGGGDLPSWAIEEGVSPEEYKKMMGYKQGGRVPKKYQGGGMVQGRVPTISDYFNMQNKSLGGSNKKSVAEILGRR